MELSASTFVLEIINFLVLVWLLTRFLYRPVLNAVTRRREEIQATLDGAAAARGEADALKADYENRLSTWEGERRAARDKLEKELAAERTHRLGELHEKLEQEREKARVLRQRELENERRENETQALDQSLSFISRLLAPLAGPELEARILERVLADLGKPGGVTNEHLRQAFSGNGKSVQVTTAFPLSESARSAFLDALNAVLGQRPDCRWQEDAAVIAGVRIGIGAWLLRATLADELKFFAEAGRET